MGSSGHLYSLTRNADFQAHFCIKCPTVNAATVDCNTFWQGVGGEAFGQVISFIICVYQAPPMWTGQQPISSRFNTAAIKRGMGMLAALPTPGSSQQVGGRGGIRHHHVTPHNGKFATSLRIFVPVVQ